MFVDLSRNGADSHGVNDCATFWSIIFRLYTLLPHSFLMDCVTLVGFFVCKWEYSNSILSLPLCNRRMHLKESSQINIIK